MAPYWDRWSWAGLGLLLLAPLLGVAIGQGWFWSWDQRLAQALSLHGPAATGQLATALQRVAWLGHFGPRMGITLVLAIGVWAWRGRIAALAFVAAPLLASGYSTALKMLFGRPRPDLIAHLDPVASASYPSGHATGAMLLYGMLVLAVPTKWRGAAAGLALVAIVMTAWSRLALGVHWGTDVVGGTILGLGALWIVRPMLLATPTR
jgi:membrane-associated phospholipid phosphatase